MSSELWQASAGTGKTHRLTEAYVEQVVAQGRHPSAVWAITFTERAAAELRSRLVARLAGAAPGRALGDPETWPVGTFHTLALRALRRDSDSNGLLSTAAAGRRVLGTGDDAASMFAAACQRAWWGGDKEIAGAVRAVAPHFDMHALPEELWQALAHAREHSCETASALWRGPSEAALAEAVAGGVWAWSEDMLAQARGLKLTPRSADKLATFAAARPAPVAPDAAGELAWAEGWRRALGGLDGRGGLRELAAAPLLRVQLARVDGLLAERRWRALRPPLAQLIDAAWSTYRADKAAAEAWDFTDLIAELVRRLSTSWAAWRRLAGDIAWLGVDEAQDTNPLQRRMVRLLVGLEGPAAGPGHAQLWVVGDPKQAIYTFRGADPRAFAALGEDVAAKGGAAHVLSVSRRSHPRLVAAINHLGDHLLGAAYAPLVAQAPAAPDVAPDPLAGMWSVTPAAAPPEADACPVASSAGVAAAAAAVSGSGSAAELAFAEAQAVADLLVDLQADGVALSACAVLTATSLHIAQLAAVLRRRQLAYGMREGGLLFQQPAVLDTLACLHALAEPGDRVAAAIALRSPAWAVGDEALTWLLAPGDAKTFASQQAAAAAAGDGPGGWRRLAAWQRHAPTLRALARHGSVVETLQALDGLTQLQAVWAATPDGPLASAALAALWRLAADFDGQGSGGVLDFCRLQAARRARQAPITLGPWQPAEPAVTLATIHQSKGLEFEFVILPHLGFGRRSAGARLQFCSELGLVGAPRDAAGQPLRPTSHLQATARAEADLTAERRRLLYVAVTRARRAVFWLGERQGAARGFRAFLADWWPGAVADRAVRSWPPPPPPPPVDAPTAPAVSTAPTFPYGSFAAAPPAPPASGAGEAAARPSETREVVDDSPVCVVDMAAQLRRHRPHLAISIDQMGAFFAPPAPPPWGSPAGESAAAERVFSALFAVLAHGPPGLLAAADIPAWVAEQLRVAGAVGEDDVAMWAASAAAALLQPSVLPLLFVPIEARRCPLPLQRSWGGTGGAVTLSCTPDLVVEAGPVGSPSHQIWAHARPLSPAAVTLAGWVAGSDTVFGPPERPEPRELPWLLGEAAPAVWLAPQRVGPTPTDFALRLWRPDSGAAARAERLVAHWLEAQLAPPLGHIAP